MFNKLLASLEFTPARSVIGSSSSSFVDTKPIAFKLPSSSGATNNIQCIVKMPCLDAIYGNKQSNKIIWLNRLLRTCFYSKQWRCLENHFPFEIQILTLARSCRRGKRDHKSEKYFAGISFAYCMHES